MNDELLEAIRTEDINRVRDLIAAGADVNFRKQTILGATPLIYAARKKNENILHLLIDSGADINGVDAIGRTALHINSNHVENIVRILIDTGIDLNIRDNDGETALMYASFYGYLSIVKMLIEGGANIYIKNKDGKNVVEFVNELYRNEKRMNLHEELHPGYKERMKSIMKILQKAENKAKKRIAIDAYMRSRDKPYLPPNAENPLSGFFHKGNDADYIMEKVLNMAYGDDENENEGAEESKSNRGDAGGRRKKSRKKSKSKKRKSVRRKKSVDKKKRSRSRKSGVRKKKSRSKRSKRSKRRKSGRK
jgi:hypothetical protein